MGGHLKRNTALLRWFAAGAATCLLAAGTALAHDLDHPMPTFSQPAPLSSTTNSGGEGATWELVATIPTGNPHTDLDFFQRSGDVYASVGTLASGPNAGGQTIVKLTNKGKVEPSYVTGHPSASCLSGSSGVTGLQHDAEATPKGGVPLNAANPFADGREAQLIVDATDAPGRCHDQGAFGVSQEGLAPQGGLELIDVSDPAKPKEIGLTSHVGQAHTVNIDPKRPHIAYVSSSDNVALNSEGKRANETSGNLFDGIEVVDMSSCMNFAPGTTLEQKRNACDPKVFRYRWPEPQVTQATSYSQVGACHELEIYPDDRIACSAITATALFDFKGAFDDNGTPADYTDDKLRGTPLPCRRRESSNEFGQFMTGAFVADCVNGGGDGTTSLTVSNWMKIGSPSLDGVRWIGTVPHMGYSANQDHATAPFGPTQDIIVAHESELTGTNRFVLTTDERGGGIIPGGASCAPGVDNPKGNGGIHAFPVGNFTTSPPRKPEDAQALAAKNSKGERALFRAEVRTKPQGAVCTSHVFQQIPGQNRIFMAWYSQGTQVVDFTENSNGTIDFKSAGWFTPDNANEWVSGIFKVQENADGTWTYWGATGDFALGDAGRNAIDVYKVTLPPAPRPNPMPAGTPKYPVSPIAGVEAEVAKRNPPVCARTTAFDRVDVKPRGRTVDFKVQRRGSRRIRFDMFRVTRGRKVVREQVADLVTNRRSFTFRPRTKLARGLYVARLRTGTASGRSDVRHFALQLTAKGFKRLASFQQHQSCRLIEQALLGRPVFGGSTKRSLGIAFEVTQPSRVTVEVRRGGKLVKRFKEKLYFHKKVHRLRFSQKRGARGVYTVRFKATAPGKSQTTSLKARRL